MLVLGLEGSRRVTVMLAKLIGKMIVVLKANVERDFCRSPVGVLQQQSSLADAHLIQ